MHPSDFFTASWTQLAEAARNALKNNDIETIRHLDTAFHHLFLNQARRGDDASRNDFVLNLLAITESQEARQKPRPDEIPLVLARWAHLALLSDAFRTAGDAVEQASQAVRSLKHGDRLLAEVARSGGLPAKDLAARLGISQQGLSPLLRKLEACDVIERRPAGQYVYVCLGLVGQLLLDREPQVVPAPSKDELTALYSVGPAKEPMANPRQLLARGA